jgi:glutamate-1-semialdehyde 2,1-aminomutase
MSNPQSNTDKSYEALLANAKFHFPLGVADSYRYWGDRDSFFVQSMKGCTLTDSEGREFVDFRLGYGPVILGYRDQRIDAEVIKGITEQGSVSGFSTELDSEVVGLLKKLCPNIEKVRFANSGTEAVMGAVRTARGFTGRNRVIVVEGGFHGLYDEMMWKSDVEGWDGSDEKAPEVIPFGSGIPRSTRDHVDFVPLNDADALRAVFSSGEEIAAVLLEPIMGNCGSISATQDYAELLRSICDRHGAMLIMDEVKTGFRVAHGGAQELYGVWADLTTYAKAMGNGYPVACFGGRAEVMDVISFAQDGVVHGGTYTANIIALSAAKATLSVLRETGALATIDRVGGEIMELLSRVFAAFEIEHCFAGPPSMFGVHFSSEVPQNYRDWKKTDSPLYTRFAWQLIRNGVMLEPDSREPWFICEAHQTVDLAWLEEVAMKSMQAAIEGKGQD